jgi:hypothetical protein
MKFDDLVNFLLEGTDVGTNTFLDTSWEDGDIKVTIKDMMEYLDSINAPVKEVGIEKIKPIIIAQDYKGAAKDRVEKADLKYPLIVTVKNGKYKSILDGNHRAFKALRDDVKTLKVREVDLDAKDTPKSYKDLFY